MPHLASRRRSQARLCRISRRRRRLRALARPPCRATVQRGWLWLGHEPEPGRKIYETVLAHVRETQQQGSTAADHLIFRLGELGTAIEAGEAGAVEEALFRLGADYGKGAGRVQVRRAAHRKHKEDGSKKRTDMSKPGGGEPAIIAAVKKLNGGELPLRLKRGTAAQVADDLGYKAGYVSYTATKWRKKES